MIRSKKKLDLAAQTVRSLQTLDEATLRDVPGALGGRLDSQCSRDFSGCINTAK